MGADSRRAAHFFSTSHCVSQFFRLCCSKPKFVCAPCAICASCSAPSVRRKYFALPPCNFRRASCADKLRASPRAAAAIGDKYATPPKQPTSDATLRSKPGAHFFASLPETLHAERAGLAAPPQPRHLGGKYGLLLGKPFGRGSSAEAALTKRSGTSKSMSVISCAHCLSFSENILAVCAVCACRIIETTSKDPPVRTQTEAGVLWSARRD